MRQDDDDPTVVRSNVEGAQPTELRTKARGEEPQETALRTIGRDAEPPQSTEKRAAERRNEQPTELRTLKHGPDPDSTEMRPTLEHPVRVESSAQPNTERMSYQPTLRSFSDATIHQLQAGDAIKNRFVLEMPIGRGGMGIVFAAVDRRKQEAGDPNPHVAIKILSGDFREHPHALVALQRESRKAQTLAHPNVVTVFDFDRDGDLVFMTMELLQGRSLEAIVREARDKGVERDIALPIIRGIAEGLAYAHRKGIVHSDLKPGNVFVTSEGGPKILDFGIARAAPNSAAAKDTFDAGVLGAYTEAYATDEMVLGGEPHPSDDLYALGLIAYELLAGVHPYKRHSPSKARELGLHPEPLKGLKRREWKAIERCLAYERAKRPKDAAEFLRLFAGISTLQKSLIAAVATLAVAAGGLAYISYQQSGPTIAFESLPVETQREFTSTMANGDKEWAFYRQHGNFVALLSAVEYYSDAYDLHPRNRRATRALEAAAKAFLVETQDDPEARQQGAQTLSDMSPFLSKYPPLMEAAAAAH